MKTTALQFVEPEKTEKKQQNKAKTTKKKQSAQKKTKQNTRHKLLNYRQLRLSIKKKEKKIGVYRFFS